MNKLTRIFSLLVAAIFILSACASGAQNNQSSEDQSGSEQGNVTEESPRGGGSFEGNATQGLPLATGTVELFATPEPTLGLEAATSEATAAPLASATQSTDLLSTPSSGGATSEPLMGTPSVPISGTQQGFGAQILPATGRGPLTRLSALMGFQVVDKNGQTVGTVSDYILNLCEAHILYMVLNADPALNAAGGSQVLIPYEAVTLKNGTLDGQKKTITLNFETSQISGLPAVDVQSLDLTSSDWETPIASFWSQLTPLSLSTNCRVANPNGGASAGNQGTGITAQATQALSTTVATPATGATTQPGSPSTVQTTKVALASKVLGSELQEGTGKVLGTVQEVILVPESGLLRYFVLQPSTDLGSTQKMILVPVRAINLPATAGQAPEGKTALVLLVDTNILKNAPGIDRLPEGNGSDWDAQTFQYWSQFVPLSKEGQP